MNEKRGFTLLEVLVALAILAVGLSAVIKTTTANAENTRYLRDKTLAHWVAMNVLTEVQVRGEWPAVGKKDDTAMMADREWFWVMKTSKTVDKELRRLDIQVFYQRKVEEPIAVLVGFVGMP